MTRTTDVTDDPVTPTQLTNYLGENVNEETRPVDIEGLNWFVTTQVQQDQVEGPLRQFRDAVQVAVALFVVVITFMTVAWAGNLFQPVRAISERLRRLHEREDDVEVEMAARAPQDFVDLAGHIDGMIDALGRREADVAAAAAERRETLRALLPASVSRRVEAGDRSVLDHIVQATVAVLVVDGLGELVRSSTIEDSRAVVDEIVDEVDQLAGQHGLERVKLIGDAYFAGCGIAHPYLDHAPRTVAFALEARDRVAEIAGDRLGLSIGIDSGPVNVGLAGSSRLVYDLWGEAVTTAHSLARAAGEGEVLASDATRAMLPTGAPVTRIDPGDGPVLWSVQRPEIGPAS